MRTSRALYVVKRRLLDDVASTDEVAASLRVELTLSDAQPVGLADSRKRDLTRTPRRLCVDRRKIDSARCLEKQTDSTANQRQASSPSDEEGEDVDSSIHKQPRRATLLQPLRTSHMPYW